MAERRETERAIDEIMNLLVRGRLRKYPNGSWLSAKLDVVEYCPECAGLVYVMRFDAMAIDGKNHVM